MYAFFIKLPEISEKTKIQSYIIIEENYKFFELIF